MGLVLLREKNTKEVQFPIQESGEYINLNYIPLTNHVPLDAPTIAFLAEELLKQNEGINLFKEILEKNIRGNNLEFRKKYNFEFLKNYWQKNNKYKFFLKIITITSYLKNT